MEVKVNNGASEEDRLKKEAPQLASVLREMKAGLDTVTSKVQALTAKVKADNLPTAEGISYLEAKHLLLINYCQSLVYYLLLKAKGFSIEGHPVVQSLVEIRLFLEKIRPIDKKLQYQIQKLTRVNATTTEQVGVDEKEADAPQKTEDLLRYRPNPDMLIRKTDAMANDDSGVYRPPKIAPAMMDEEKMSRQEKNALRKKKMALRQASQNSYVREMVDNLEDRPEEIREIIGTESKEYSKYVAKWEERERQEEELFTRAPVTRKEKYQAKHLLKSRNGLQGLTESFFDEIKSLPLGDIGDDQPKSFGNNKGTRKFKKPKRRH